MRKAAAVLLALLLGGCTKAVQILDPPGAATTPVTQFKVKFAGQFKPGTFHAELDGRDMTAGFLPTPKPGGVSVLVLPDTPEGFTGGTMVNGGQPQRPLPVGTLPPDIHFTPGQAPATGGGGTGGGGGSTNPPAPNIALFHHTLRAFAECNGMLCDTTDEMEFFPLHLLGAPLGMNLRVGQKGFATATTYLPATVNVPVRIRPLNVAVSINGLPPGAAFDTVIPAKGQSPQFSITALLSSNLVVILESRGVQMGSIQGVIDP